MEKIININLAGRVIAIEDTAYTTLKNYLESLRVYFAEEEGRDEIINDIESRIAELMGDQIKRGSTAITDADVHVIIASMGRVEDFAAADSEENIPHDAASSSYAGGGRRKGTKRFFRDSNDKILGGVCSGLAAYLNVDPALVRIVFAILTLGGWGAGLLLYIALWILVPAAPLVGFRGRRLFRNPDDRILGGVSGGLGAYFDKDAWVFRCIFAIPLILSMLSGILHVIDGDIIFGSFSGTFILVYIVLWAVLPEANSEFEKMEMRGEKVDVSSIRNNVYAGMDDIKTRAREWTGEVKESVSRLSSEAAQFASTRGPQFAREATAAVRPIAARGGHILATIIKGFFLFIASTIAFALFIVLITYSFSGMSDIARDFVFRDNTQVALAWAAIILCFGVPLVSIVTLIVRRILKIRSRNSYLGWTFTGLWVAGFICIICLVASVAEDFRRYEKVSAEIPVIQPAAGKLTLKVTDPAIEYHNTFSWLHTDENGWDISNDSISLSRVQIRADVSPDSQYHVTLRRYSAGNSRTEALARAQQINYPVSAANDSTLVLGNGYSIYKAQKYRRQNVVVDVLVPVGKKLRIDHSVVEKLSANEFLADETAYRHNRRWNPEWDDVYETWDADIDYVMTAEGKLVNPVDSVKKSTVLADSSTSRTAASLHEVDSLDKEMEALKRKREEALQKAHK